LGSFAQQKTDAALATDATVIKNATVAGSNTATRIGTMFLDIIKNKSNKIYQYTASGTNAYSVNVDPVQTSYASGDWYFIKFNNANTTTSVTIDVNSLGAVPIKKTDGSSLAIGDIPDGSIQLISYDGANFQVLSSSTGGGGGGSDTFTGDITFVLSGGKPFGKYTNGQTAHWAGLTAVQAMTDAAIEYINPVFTAFNVSGQSTTVEVGTTLSGTKTFTWSIAANSGTVSTINIVDNNTSTNLVTNTPNDGSQLQSIATIQLNSNGASQSWKLVGNNSSPTGTFNSGDFNVIGRFYLFQGSVSSSLTNSASVRALNQSFYTGASSVTLNTGTTNTKFTIALPPGVTITSVTDTDALGAVITSSYVMQSTIAVIDAGGTGRFYNIYEMNIGAAYSTSHRHVINFN
jgi:hypothetical protein